MKSSVIIFALLAGCNAQLRYFSSIEEFKDSLQPVQGLYVKPSTDGETGDLYVAASEDNGVQTPWVADTSVKLLPPTKQSSEGPQPTQQYNTPLSGNEGNLAVVSAPKELISEEQPQFIQVPQFFYPQLLAPASSSGEGTTKKEAKPLSSNAVTSLPYNYMQSWNYGYPQYVLVDPEGWAQAQMSGEQVKPTGQQVKLIKL